MLIFKRIITASISFLVLFFVFYFGIMIIGGALTGVMAGVDNSENMQITAEQAGEQFAMKYFGIIALASLGLSAIGSGILAFGGMLPWCKRRKQSPIQPHDNQNHGNR